MMARGIVPGGVGRIAVGIGHMADGGRIEQAVGQAGGTCHRLAGLRHGHAGQHGRLGHQQGCKRKPTGQAPQNLPRRPSIMPALVCGSPPMPRHRRSVGMRGVSQICDITPQRPPGRHRSAG
jgi:hypothetical protein